jgi:hypothetical protein
MIFEIDSYKNFSLETGFPSRSICLGKSDSSVIAIFRKPSPRFYNQINYFVFLFSNLVKDFDLDKLFGQIKYIIEVYLKDVLMMELIYNKMPYKHE